MPITVDNSGSNQGASFSYSCGASATVLVVLIEQDYGTTVTGVTYGGVSMTQQDYKTDFQVQCIFTLNSPLIGSNTLSVSTTGSPTKTNVYAISFNEASIISPVDGIGYCAYPGSGGIATIPITTAHNNTYVVDLGYGNNVASTLTPGSGQTAIGSQQSNSSNGEVQASYKQFVTAGSNSTSWTGLGGGVGGISIGIAADNTLGISVVDSTTTSESVASLLVFPLSGIYFDNSYSPGGNTGTFNFTVSSLITNGYLFVLTSNSNSSTPSVTYNGVSMTLLASYNTQHFIFGLANPATGTNSVVVSSIGTNCFVLAASYGGVRAVHQPDAYAGASGSSSAAPSVTVVDPNCWMIGIGATIGPSGTQLTSSSNVLVKGAYYNQSVSVVIAQDTGGIVGTGAQAMSWSNVGPAEGVQALSLSFAPQYTLSVIDSTSTSENEHANVVDQMSVFDSTNVSNGEYLNFLMEGLPILQANEYTSTSEFCQVIIVNEDAIVSDTVTVTGGEYVQINVIDQENLIIDSTQTSEFVNTSIYKSDQQEIFQYLIGNNDDGASISTWAETGDSSFGVAFESIIYPVEISINVKEGHDMTIYLGIDGGSLIPIGTVKRGMNRVPIDIDPRSTLYARGRMFRFAVKEYSQASVIIANAAIKYYLSSETEEYRGDRDEPNET